MALTTNYKLANIFNSKKASTFTTGGLTIFMIVLMLVLAILPAYRSITDQLKNNEAKSQYLGQLKQKRQAMDDLSEEYAEKKDTINLYEKYNGKKPNTEVLLANLSEICKKDGCVLNSVSFNQPNGTTDEQISSVSGVVPKQISLSVLGTLEQLDTFIKDLEEFPVPFNTQNISYTHYKEQKANSGGQDESPIINDPRFSLSIVIEYYLWSN